MIAGRAGWESFLEFCSRGARPILDTHGVFGIFSRLLFYDHVLRVQNGTSKFQIASLKSNKGSPTPRITPNMQIISSENIVTVDSVDALDGFESPHCSATFLLELANKSLAFSLQPFFAILCVPRDPFLDRHLLLWAGQASFHAVEKSR